jgi:hypothetical protein
VDIRTLPDAVELVRLPAPEATQIKSIQFSSDRARLLTMSGSGGVYEWDLAGLRQTLATMGLNW